MRVIYLVAPLEVLKKRNRVTGLKMRIHTLGESDASGRRRPDPVAETDFALQCDMVINALGQAVGELEGVAITPEGTIACDAETGATEAEGVFAGGDAATGPDNVIAAVASGRRAAASIDRLLSGEEAFLSYDPVLTEVSRDTVLARTKIAGKEPRVGLELRPAGERKGDFETYAPALTEAEAVREASRCLSCLVHRRGEVRGLWNVLPPVSEPEHRDGPSGGDDLTRDRQLGPEAGNWDPRQATGTRGRQLGPETGSWEQSR